VIAMRDDDPIGQLFEHAESALNKRDLYRRIMAQAEKLKKSGPLLQRRLDKAADLLKGIRRRRGKAGG
jgi:hypothetical protein